ncbi:MAG: hypothetical protein M1835_003022 [Candelina submexicana]|nr:MAG: hypothetical protein M1835_003022 [Candelina submexicana]
MELSGKLFEAGLVDSKETRLERKSSREGSLRRRRRLSKTTQKGARRSSYSLTSKEEKRSVPELSEKSASAINIPRMPATIVSRKLTSQPNDRGDIPSYYFHNSASRATLPPERRSDLQTAPTLRGKRSANESVLPRRKSSKKKKQDEQSREAEIKAMSAAMPNLKRPVTYTGGELRRETTRAQGGLNRRLERPTSDISLPFPESVQSSLSSASDQHAFKVSAFDVLSPRPTLRYSDPSRRPAIWNDRDPSRSGSRREKGPMIPEEPINEDKRMDELADTLDAGGLRELMERDQRRREKKRKSDQERLQRKLERKAAKQRAEVEKKGAGTGNGGPANEIMGLGIAGDPTRSCEPGRVEEPGSPLSWLPSPSKDNIPVDPFSDQNAESAGLPTGAPTPAEEFQEEPVIGTAQAIRLSQASMSPPTLPSQQAHSASIITEVTNIRPESVLEVPEVQKSVRRGSDNSSRQAGSWASLFRRSGTKLKRDSIDRGRFTPSEFSNTSRESMSRQPPIIPMQRTYQRRSGTPVRTQSKFREELPEFPISPPDSRVQSPEAVPPVPTDAKQNNVGLVQTVSGAAGSPVSADPFADPSTRSRNQSGRQSSDPPSPEAGGASNLSQSLASVDSEGSWLSGRPVKRTSQNQTYPSRNSANSLQDRYKDMSPSDDELGVADDPYFSHVAPVSEEPSIARRPVHNIRKPSSLYSDDENIHELNASEHEQGKWHEAVAKHPTIVHRTPRAKSREGLLNDFEDESVQPTPEETPGGESQGYLLNAPDAPWVQRATSVELGARHVRHISAGSAKLLDLPRRPSTDLKRMSA